MTSSSLTSHPDPQQLANFGQGRLPPAESERVQAHLEQCAACRQALAKLPGGAEALSGQEKTRTVDSGNQQKELIPGDLVNHPRYEILQLLGRGGMGSVYKARHKKMNRVVALKIINAQLLGNAKAVERFHREVEAAAQLHHANIVTAFDADQAGGTHFLVMEFVEGIDLAKYAEKKGPLPAAHACHFIRQAALGLQHAHEKNLVHRDIKPHNLMLTAGGVVKVMDFGLARLGRAGASEATGLTGSNVLMGTPDYIAPEQAEDAHTADIRTDIYSLGCSLFHLLAGRPPLAGGSLAHKLAAHLAGKVPLAELPASVPEELRTVLAKMVAREPAMRYQVPGEVAQALTPFVKKATGAKLPPIAAIVPLADAQGERTITHDPARPNPIRKQKSARRWPLALGIGVGFIAAALLIASIILRTGTGPFPTRGPSSGAEDAALVEMKQPEALPTRFTNDLGMDFVLVPRGRFLMGGGGGTVGDKEVEIAYDFYLGTYEVTQGEWEAIMGINPSRFSRSGGGRNEVADIANKDLKRFPVELVSWDDAQLYLARVNAAANEQGWRYRLPKESEWEYACRGGPVSPKEYGFDYYLEKPSNLLLPDQANFASGSEKDRRRTCKVGRFQPNRLGLFDMHGNVWEWCDDADKGSRRCSRGGSWLADSERCRAACLHPLPPSLRDTALGLRLARVPRD